MAAQSRRTDPPLDRTLFEEAYRFDFFQAVRLLERLYADRQPVGRDAAPSQEVVRFAAHLSLSFPPSEIHELAPSADGTTPARMTVAFLGLTGPHGVLPRHYTELLLERARLKDHTLREFLDLFNHRLTALFFRAWEKYRVAIGYERATTRKEGYDQFTLALFDLIGLGTAGLRGRLQVDDDAFLYYAGLLAQQPRSATALAGVLTDYLGVPVHVAQLRGRWLPMPAESYSRLGSPDPRTGLLRDDANNVLGVNALIGSRVWDQQAGFRLRLGPLSFAQLSDLLPSGDVFRPFVQLARFFVGQEFDFDVQFVVKAAEVPGCRLGDEGARAPRLGWSTWLKTDPFSRDAEDPILGGRLTEIGALPA
jgi:type VI secretion system protein ImpH